MKHEEHSHHGDHGDLSTIQFTQEFWDDRYRSAGRLWSGQPNPQLVAQTAGLTPGDALDAGCGEGADAIWLARRGWNVTAVDVSAVALERAAASAGVEGVPARIVWRREDGRASPASVTLMVIGNSCGPRPRLSDEIRLILTTIEPRPVWGKPQAWLRAAGSG